VIEERREDWPDLQAAALLNKVMVGDRLAVAADRKVDAPEVAKDL